MQLEQSAQEFLNAIETKINQVTNWHVTKHIGFLGGATVSYREQGSEKGKAEKKNKTVPSHVKEILEVTTRAENETHEFLHGMVKLGKVLVDAKPYAREGKVSVKGRGLAVQKFYAGVANDYIQWVTKQAGFLATKKGDPEQLLQFASALQRLKNAVESVEVAKAVMPSSKVFGAGGK